MRTNRFVKQCGPFEVVSYSQDRHGVRLTVYAAFPQYGDDWAVTRIKGQGGGPSIFTAMALARDLEEVLNQPYEEGAITKWKRTLKEMLACIPKRKEEGLNESP